MIWDIIKQKMLENKIKKAMSAGVTNTVGPVTSVNAPAQQPTGNVSVQNAQSWNRETHPEGRGDSYLVDNIDYDASTGKLDVQYRDGFTAEYDNISPNEARDFSQADSKGRWARAHLWDLPYKKI